MKGLVITGEFGCVLAREKTNDPFELGELVITELEGGQKILLQVVDLLFGSQISQQNLELISGLKLEEDDTLQVMDKELRLYKLAKLKSIALLDGRGAHHCKRLPPYFAGLREVREKDLTFLTRPAHPLYLGQLRSGSKELDTPIYLDAHKTLTHHILIPATTGKGKSNLASCLIWDNIAQKHAGMLVLDPHDEYYGRTGQGMKDHPRAKGNVMYLTPKNPPPGSLTLKIKLDQLRPAHFNGVSAWSDPQQEAITAYYRQFRDSWIEAIIKEQPLQRMQFHEGTLAVVRRRLMNLLDLSYDGERLVCKGVFDTIAGGSTVREIVSALESGLTVIIDTSDFNGAVELLIGSLLATEALRKYRWHKRTGELAHKPPLSVVIEEAPRVLGKEVLERGPNIFSTIAREGRKFKVGLVAITQLPSLIPRQILANMNTKIILGTEMRTERAAIIDSAAQDLSADERAIASLDAGEAIVTSNFIRFATPIKIPLFEDIVKKEKQEVKARPSFSGIKLT